VEVKINVSCILKLYIQLQLYLKAYSPPVLVRFRTRMDLSHSRNFYYMSGRFFFQCERFLAFSKIQNMFHKLNNFVFIKNYY
jgi:hypothetical protein